MKAQEFIDWFFTDWLKNKPPGSIIVKRKPGYGLENTEESGFDEIGLLHEREIRQKIIDRKDDLFYGEKY